MDGTDVEDLEIRCFKMLVELDAVLLKEVAEKLGLQVPNELVGKRKPLYKLIIKYLNSDDVQGNDGAYEVFTGLDVFLSEKLSSETSETKDVKPDVPVLEGITKLKPDGLKNYFGSVVDLQRPKELKINGRIGGIGEKDRLSYGSLSYQIKDAQKMGYSDETICSAVVKAITPGTNLRTYLESRSSVTLKSLIEIMRSHFREKDSASYFSELNNAVQAPHENCYDFVVRLMVIRDKVISLAEEEGCPQNPSLVKQKFAHTISTGLRNNNIRHDLRGFLKEKHFSDEELLKVVTEAVANEVEHADKVEKKIGKVNFMDVKSDSPNLEKKKNKDPPLPQQIQELKGFYEDEMTKMREEIGELKTLIQESSNARSRDNELEEIKMMLRQPSYRGGRGASNRGSGGFRLNRRCSSCVADDNRICGHCFKCGAGGHRMSDCPGN